MGTHTIGCRFRVLHGCDQYIQNQVRPARQHAVFKTSPMSNMCSQTLPLDVKYVVLINFKWSRAQYDALQARCPKSRQRTFDVDVIGAFYIIHINIFVHRPGDIILLFLFGF